MHRGDGQKELKKDLFEEKDVFPAGLNNTHESNSVTITVPVDSKTLTLTPELKMISLPVSIHLKHKMSSLESTNKNRLKQMIAIREDKNSIFKLAYVGKIEKRIHQFCDENKIASNHIKKRVNDIFAPYSSKQESVVVSIGKVLEKLIEDECIQTEAQFISKLNEFIDVLSNYLDAILSTAVKSFEEIDLKRLAIEKLTKEEIELKKANVMLQADVKGARHLLSLIDDQDIKEEAVKKESELKASNIHLNQIRMQLDHALSEYNEKCLEQEEKIFYEIKRNIKQILQDADQEISYLDQDQKNQLMHKLVGLDDKSFLVSENSREDEKRSLSRFFEGIERQPYTQLVNSLITQMFDVSNNPVLEKQDGSVTKLIREAVRNQIDLGLIKTVEEGEKVITQFLNFIRWSFQVKEKGVQLLVEVKSNLEKEVKSLNTNRLDNRIAEIKEKDIPNEIKRIKKLNKEKLKKEFNDRFRILFRAVYDEPNIVQREQCYEDLMQKWLPQVCKRLDFDEKNLFKLGEGIKLSLVGKDKKLDDKNSVGKDRFDLDAKNLEILLDEIEHQFIFHYDTKNVGPEDCKELQLELEALNKQKQGCLQQLREKRALLDNTNQKIRDQLQAMLGALEREIIDGAASINKFLEMNKEAKAYFEHKGSEINKKRIVVDDKIRQRDKKIARLPQLIDKVRKRLFADKIIETGEVASTKLALHDVEDNKADEKASAPTSLGEIFDPLDSVLSQVINNISEPEKSEVLVELSDRFSGIAEAKYTGEVQVKKHVESIQDKVQKMINTKGKDDKSELKAMSLDNRIRAILVDCALKQSFAKGEENKIDEDKLREIEQKNEAIFKEIKSIAERLTTPFPKLKGNSSQVNQQMRATLEKEISREIKDEKMLAVLSTSEGRRQGDIGFLLHGKEEPEKLRLKDALIADYQQLEKVVEEFRVHVQNMLLDRMQSSATARELLTLPKDYLILNSLLSNIFSIFNSYDYDDVKNQNTSKVTMLKVLAAELYNQCQSKPNPFDPVAVTRGLLVLLKGMLISTHEHMNGLGFFGKLKSVKEKIKSGTYISSIELAINTAEAANPDLKSVKGVSLNIHMQDLMSNLLAETKLSQANAILPKIKK